MTTVGDRIVVESEKVGMPDRCGTVAAVDGQMLRVKWDDGSESSFIPAAGSLRVVPDAPSA
jgi:Domain of unknown function (DUF1918)